ncbi:hypothetical protein PGTUg99_006976 [Puccinia graminis f. sp. tritici]|uniref:Uncharacterized protein n=1 Tax=Puccinia graminis f. sp. tritici TaxID=56615 RepID=A0A5B0SDT6_PUCGR|nr:hypothetical protein PGTUg99_006976 [Puccinia graminis f. sp. tritici]
MHGRSDRRPRKKLEAGNWWRMSAALIGIEVGSQILVFTCRNMNPDWNGALGTRHQWQGALSCGRSFSSTSRNPNQTRTPNDQNTPLGPSQRAFQLKFSIHSCSTSTERSPRRLVLRSCAQRAAKSKFL